MNNPTKFLIDGVDRLGKSTLIENIQQMLGYHLMVHYDKPKSLKCYKNVYTDPLERYQKACNYNMFHLLQSSVKVIFDRTHLGELVYAPIYRGYSGDYVLELEARHNTSDARLILMTTSDMNVGEDDGESYDWSKREQEQEAFKAAFARSTIKDKLIIDVSNGQGGYRDAQDILAEALKLDVQTNKVSL